MPARIRVLHVPTCGSLSNRSQKPQLKTEDMLCAGCFRDKTIWETRQEQVFEMEGRNVSGREGQEGASGCCEASSLLCRGGDDATCGMEIFK